MGYFIIISVNSGILASYCKTALAKQVQPRFSIPFILFPNGDMY